MREKTVKTYEGGDAPRMARILGILSELLHETGQLVSQAPVEAPSAKASSEAAGPAGADRAPADAPVAAGDEPLFFVCEGPHGPVAFPWAWVVATRLAEEGGLLGVRVVDAHGERELALGRVLGLWSWKELAQRGGSVHHFFDPADLVARFSRESAHRLAASEGTARQPEDATAGAAVDPQAGPAQAFRIPRLEQLQVVDDDSVEETTLFPGLQVLAPLRSTPSPAPAVAPGPVAPPAPIPASASGHPQAAAPVSAAVPGQPQAAAPVPAAAAPSAHVPALPLIPEQLGIISPSALARRFLMRHLCELGYEVLEARDLDDPLLPADLRGVAALFLDESLYDDWASRPAAAGGNIPLVLLTVDGELSVPRYGDPPSRTAVLPRPFERAEVERVVRWLRASRTGGAEQEDGDHGNAQDDTWLFADPFGPAGAREHSRC
jgi:hypothetical protein